MGKDTELSKGVFIAIIAVVAVVACLAGYFIFINPPNGVPNSTREAYMKKMQQESGGGQSSGKMSSGGMDPSGRRSPNTGTSGQGSP